MSQWRLAFNRLEHGLAVNATVGVVVFVVVEFQDFGFS